MHMICYQWWVIIRGGGFTNGQSCDGSAECKHKSRFPSVFVSKRPKILRLRQAFGPFWDPSEVVGGGPQRAGTKPKIKKKPAKVPNLQSIREGIFQIL